MSKLTGKALVIKSTLVAAALLTTGIAQSGDSSVADEYMKIYADSDAGLNALGKFYSKDAIFRDPTSEKWPGYAWNMDGKKQILEKLKSHLAQFDKISIAYIVKTKYEAGGHTVYTGKFKSSKVKQGALETNCTWVTTIISVKDGKVVEHRDYFDYDTWEASKKVGDQDC